MDTSADIIQLECDIQDVCEISGDSSIVDLTSDITTNKAAKTKEPVDVVTDVDNSEDVEEGEVEEAHEVTDLVEHSPNVQTLAFEIKFANKGVFQQYGHAILDALDKTLNVSLHDTVSPLFEFGIVNAEQHLEGDTGNCIQAFLIKQKVPETSCVSVSDCEEAVVDEIDTSKQVRSVSRDISPDIDLSSLFTLDTSGSSKLDTQCVPSYKRVIKDVLDEESVERKKQKQEKDQTECPRVRSAAACFNCGVGGHSLRECPKPRNNARINRAKSARKQERYHIDVEQRFGHLRPGVISDKLQAALGLRRGELPFFFYRMRKLGYPPGWLEEAKVEHSGISLFNSDGNVVMCSEEENSQESEEQKFDVSKIIDFPGFNVDPGPNFYDDYKHHNVPPMSRQQRKAEFIKQLGNNVIKGYKRKKLKSLPNLTNADVKCASTLGTTDMEIEDDDGALESNLVFTYPPPPPEPSNHNKPPPPPPPSPPIDTTPALPPKNTNLANSLCPLEGERTNSPTLDDLESRKQKLLAELNSGLADTEFEAVLSESTNGTTSLVEAESEEILSIDVPPKLPTAEELFPDESTTPANGSMRSHDVIKESHMGTPVLQFSPFEKLPAGENFKVGVSDVINFENLPDSTGKYEQMKKVIKKVRNIVTRLHNDDD